MLFRSKSNIKPFSKSFFKLYSRMTVLGIKIKVKKIGQPTSRAFLYIGKKLTCASIKSD